MNRFVQGHLREYGFHLLFNRLGVYATDLDFMVRDRNGNICCLLEVKEIRYDTQELSNWHVQPYLEIAEALGVPFYFIRYYEDFTGFKIIKYESDGTEVIRTKIRKGNMTEEALREFLNGLADGKPLEELEKVTTSLEESF